MESKSLHWRVPFGFCVFLSVTFAFSFQVTYFKDHIAEMSQDHTAILTPEPPPAPELN